MKCIKHVTSALLQRLGGIVDWPTSQEGRRKIATRFSKKGHPYGFPLVVGAVDGTLIGITPPRESGSIYIGRHDQACLNVIAISDAAKKFVYFAAKYAGSTHDSRVFKETIGRRFENGFRPLEDGVLLADSAYAASDYLIPMRERQIFNEFDEKFYRCHAQTRVDVEQLFGQFKRRFGSLGNFGPLRFRRVEMSANVIMACAIMQNFIIISRTEDEIDDDTFVEDLEIQNSSFEKELTEDANNKIAAAERLISIKKMFKQYNYL